MVLIIRLSGKARAVFGAITTMAEKAGKKLTIGEIVRLSQIQK